MKKTVTYITDVFLIGMILAGLLFCAIPAEDRFYGVFGYCLLWVLAVGMGILSTPRTKYSTGTAVGICLLPMSLEYLIAYQGEFFWTSVIISLLIAAVSTAVTFFGRYSVLRKRKIRYWGRFIQNLLFQLRTIICLILVFSCVLFGCIDLGGSNAVSPVEPDREISARQIKPILETMGNRIDIVSKLEESYWKTLSERERLTTMQEIADLEADHLGLPYQLLVTVGPMMRESCLGTYSHRKREIRFNETIFADSSAEYLLSILLHEVNHAQEHAAVEAYEEASDSYKNLSLFDKARVYAYEFENYVSGEEDYDSYASQAVESDSREYSDTRIEDYRKVIAYVSQSDS